MHAVSRVLVLAGWTHILKSKFTNNLQIVEMYTYTPFTSCTVCHTLKLYPWFTKNLCRFVEKCISSVS